jgi:hypothetical protein
MYINFRNYKNTTTNFSACSKKNLQIYQNPPDGEYYRFDNHNSNNLKLVDETKNKERF